MSDKKVKCPACGEKFSLDEDLEVGGTTCCPGCYV
jgi:formylmethanofuran dehydrogenase subunit E